MRFTRHLLLISQTLTFDIASAFPLHTASMVTPTQHPIRDRGTDTSYPPKLFSRWEASSRHIPPSPSHQTASTDNPIGTPFRALPQPQHEPQPQSARPSPAPTAAHFSETSKSDVTSGLESPNARTVQRLADAARRWKARVDASIPHEHLVGTANTTMSMRKRDAGADRRAPVPSWVRLANRVLSAEEGRRDGIGGLV